MFGCTADEVIGRDVDMLFISEDVALGAPIKERDIAKAGVPAEDDRWMRRRDGSHFWANGVLHALSSDSGELLGFGKVLRNRTDLKGHLESQLREIQSLRRQSERAGQFIATLSHELHNPLSSLAAATALLKTNPDDLETRKFAISVIERQLEFSTRLVDDLLDVTRIRHGKVRLQRSRIDLRAVLLDSVQAVSSHVDGKHQALHQILGSVAVEVTVDADRMQQVFVNLFQNASKYTNAHGEIWLKLFYEGKDAVVKVEDNGIGISTDILPQIFDLFAQAEHSQEHSVGGLGVAYPSLRI